MPPFELEQFAKAVTDGIAFPNKRQEIKDELLEHMEEVYGQNLATGMDEETAAKNAIERMGNPVNLRGKFAQLYPTSPVKLINHSLKTLLWGFWWFFLQTALYAYTPFGYFAQICTFALCFEGLFLLRKISCHLKAAFWVNIIGSTGFLTCMFLQAFFVLSLSAIHFTYLLQTAYMMLLYILLFRDFSVQAKKEKQEREVSPDEALHPLRGCIGMLSAHMLFLAGTALGIMKLGILFGIFGALLLLAVTVLHIMPADRLYMRAEFEERLYTKSHKGIRWSVFAVLLLVSVGFSCIAAVRQPKTQIPVIADCTDDGTEAAAARAHMLSLGFPQDILNDLPDSEVLQYKDALLMVDDSSQEYKFTDLSYIAYGFYLPETETQPYRLRYILRISESEALSTRYRGALYGTKHWKGNAGSEYTIPSPEFDGTFYRILCEKDGKTVEILPFYQKNPTCAADLDEPYGCEFGYLQNAQNTRIYFAETVSAAATEPTSVAIDFYQLQTPLLQNNTRIITALARNENINSVLSNSGYSKEWLDLDFFDTDTTGTEEKTA